MADDSLGTEVNISLDPQPLPLLDDIDISVRVKGLESIRVAQAHIEGQTMYMGIQIVPLVLVSPDVDPDPIQHQSLAPQANKLTNTLSEQRLSGTLQLPICTSRKMEWNANLVIQTASQAYRVAFPFTTTAP